MMAKEGFHGNKSVCESVEFVLFSVFLSVFLTVFLSVSLSVFLSVFLSIYLTVYIFKIIFIRWWRKRIVSVVGINQCARVWEFFYFRYRQISHTCNDQISWFVIRCSYWFVFISCDLWPNIVLISLIRFPNLLSDFGISGGISASRGARKVFEKRKIIRI